MKKNMAKSEGRALLTIETLKTFYCCIEMPLCGTNATHSVLKLYRSTRGFYGTVIIVWLGHVEAQLECDVIVEFLFFAYGIRLNFLCLLIFFRDLEQFAVPVFFFSLALIPFPFFSCFFCLYLIFRHLTLVTRYLTWEICFLYI